ncbi:B-cell receptor CD22-like isoform X1 [Gadus macrocephalus]|uniref:B-cell receptor CD22-like isoform X1 n=1 Tax=Gadus macrocephalus TaxID=80720 RepID=UPI0028CB5306|nr:B-cell receptor CD22-like isoform X1 [Gadus macrocephalus]
MNLRTAAGGFVAFLLSVPALQGNDDWAVTYPSSNISALRGSTVEIHCNYEYPYYTVEKEFWFTNIDNEPVDLKDDTDYTGRVEYHCGDPSCNWFYSSCTGTCTLIIKDLRQSDSAEYKFKITTDNGEAYSGDPGVKLSVTDAPETPSVGVTPPGVIKEGSSVSLTCTSKANPVAKYTWTKVTTGHSPGRSFQGQQLSFHPIQSSDSGQYLCTAKNDLGTKTSSPISIDVKYAPKTPSVSVRSPPGVIKEGSSVSLTCTSKANPVAKYTWSKVTTGHSPGHTVQGQQLSFHPIQSSHSGQYICTAKNDLGTKTSSPISIDVKYGPKRTFVRPSRPGKIKEGGSVTLSCSSDANPAAKYTWFKDNQPLLWEPSQLYTLDPVRSQDRGTYRCQARNQYGYLASNSVFIDVLCKWKTIIIVTSLARKREDHIKPDIFDRVK